MIIVTDEELADKIVALGVGHRIDMEPPHSGTAWVLFDDDIAFLTAESFVHDWRVVGALMEKCAEIGAELHGKRWKVQAWNRKDGFGENKSLPRAIIEACVEALTNE